MVCAGHDHLGLVTVGLAFTQNVMMFWVVRFLLGAAEAGFFPGVLFLAAAFCFAGVMIFVVQAALGRARAVVAAE